MTDTLLNPIRTAVTAGGVQVFAANPYASYREIRNLDAANDIAIGNNGVTFATGHIVKAGQSVVFQNPTGAAIYAITNTGITVNISAIEF